jgi:hypothetical protein
MKGRLISGVVKGVCLLLVAAAGGARADDRMMEMKVSVSRGTGDNPMIVVWAETATGDFVKTIQMFSKDKEYYKDMLAWRFKSRNKETDVDGVTGATINWRREKTISFPVEENGVNLLDGNHVLRLEARQWKGNHYRNFKIELPREYTGGTHEDKGYVESVEIVVK